MALIVLCGGLLTACSPEHYRRDADREVYDIIESKSDAVEGMPQEVEEIDRPPVDPLEGVERASEENIIPEEREPGAERPPLQVNLERALWIASVNSRDYQDRREGVYLTALDLTGERDAFEPLFSGILGGQFDHNPDDSEEVSADSALGFDWLLKTGGTISAEVATSVSQFLTGDPREAARSLFSLTLAQPLLRDRTIATTEPLTQAERDVYYEMRRFVRFQRTFFVGVYTDYFRVLERRQVLRNELVNYQNLVKARERAEAMAEAGRLPEFQVDQTRQDELRAKDRLERAQQSYHESIDAFKLTLALPTELNLALDLNELEALQEAEPAPLPYARSWAQEVATQQRLDLHTARGRVEDAERRVEVAINQLLPGLDVVLELRSDTEQNKPLKFSGNNNDYTAAVELDLPLERTAERNAFRRRLIQADAARRDFVQLRDTVVQQVRNSWRAYQRARRTYHIQRRSLDLARSRVQSTSMLLQAGRANTRDMLEAREALLGAQNSLVQAVVDYKVARLELARDMDILTVQDTGQMEANFREYAPEE